MLTAIFYLAIVLAGTYLVLTGDMLTAIFYLAIVLAGTYLVLTGNKLFEGYEKDRKRVIYFVLTVVFIVLSVSIVLDTVRSLYDPTSIFLRSR